MFKGPPSVDSDARGEYRPYCTVPRSLIHDWVTEKASFHWSLQVQGEVAEPLKSYLESRNTSYPELESRNTSYRELASLALEREGQINEDLLNKCLCDHDNKGLESDYEEVRSLCCNKVLCGGTFVNAVFDDIDFPECPWSPVSSIL